MCTIPFRRRDQKLKLCRPFIENAFPYTYQNFSKDIFFSWHLFPARCFAFIASDKKKIHTHTHVHVRSICTPYVNANNHEHRRVSCRYGSHRFVGTKLSNAKLSSVYCALTVRQSPIAIFDSYLFREGCRGKRTALFFYSPALESFREISTLDYEDYGFISWRYCDIFLDRKEKKRRVPVVRLLRVNRTGLRENFLEFFFEI